MAFRSIDIRVKLTYSKKVGICNVQHTQITNRLFYKNDGITMMSFSKHSHLDFCTYEFGNF